MEECKELFQSRKPKARKKAIDSIKEKLFEKRDRIKELTPEITEEEALKMIDVLEKKAICTRKCTKMFSKSAQSTESRNQGFSTSTN